MNSLSWFLYFADVLGNLKALAVGGLIGTGVAWVILNIAIPATEGEILEWQDFKKWWTRGVAGMLTFGIMACFLPSQNTIYAIAASQIGERVAQNEVVQGVAGDAAKALQEWIKKQLVPSEKK